MTTFKVISYDKNVWQYWFARSVQVCYLKNVFEDNLPTFTAYNSKKNKNLMNKIRPWNIKNLIGYQIKQFAAT